MTTDVITVGSEATVGEIAALLVHHRISAVPVVSYDNRVIGIVSRPTWAIAARRALRGGASGGWTYSPMPTQKRASTSRATGSRLKM